VLVYLGKKIPRYVISNYRYLEKSFPKHELWIVLDEPRLAERLRKKGIRTWVASKSKISNASYRNGFWTQTLNRFFALEEFFLQNSNGSVLHVEADVILFPTFPIDQLDDITKNIAYPLSDSMVGVASTFWLRTSEDISFFCDFLRQKKFTEPHLIDTTALGLFAKAHTDKVLVLRSGLDSALSYNNLDDLRLTGDDDAINSKGIFDASTLGIYLCGTDPRNTFGVSHLFSPLRHHRINPESLSFRSENSVLFAELGSELRPIYSLHNHSKDKRLFNSGNENYLLNRYLRSNGFTAWSFSLIGFRGFVYDYIQIVRFKIQFNFSWFSR
jgi:hypothetical protein